MTVTPHEDEFITSKNKTFPAKQHYSNILIIEYNARIYFPTFQKRHKHIQLASALFFFYFKELTQKYNEFFNYPNISSLFFEKISNQIQEPHQKSF